MLINKVGQQNLHHINKNNKTTPIIIRSVQQNAKCNYERTNLQNIVRLKQCNQRTAQHKNTQQSTHQPSHQHKIQQRKQRIHQRIHKTTNHQSPQPTQQCQIQAIKK